MTINCQCCMSIPSDKHYIPSWLVGFILFLFLVAQP